MAKRIRIIPWLDESQLRKQLDKIGKQKERIKVDVDSTNINNANRNMKQLGNTVSNTNSIFGKLKTTVGNTFSSGKLAMTSYLMVLNEINKASRNAKQTIMDVDQAVTNLSVAMNGTRAEAAEYIKTLNKQAMDLKVTTNSVVEASDAWLRQGKNIKETETLIKDSLVLSKVGEIESADATNYLTSALNGYKLEAKDAISVIDKLTAVDAQSASEAGGLALSMSRTASAASMAGVSLDKLIGWIATVKEISRDADESVGNMMKSMLSRMNQVRAGKFLDAETGESLNDMEKTLNKIGIAMRDANGQFISSEIVLDELGQKFNEFDSVTQRAVATQLGGTYQYEKVIALLSNYSKALEYAKIASESSGSAMQKFNESYLGSIQAQQNALQAAFESMIINSDFDEVYGSIISATKALVEFIDKTNGLKGIAAGILTTGLLKGFISLKAGITEAYITLNQFHKALNISRQTQITTDAFENMLVLSKNLSLSQIKLIVSSKALGVEQREQLLMASGLSAEQSKQILTTIGLATAENGLAGSTLTLGNAFKALGATLLANPIFLIATALSVGVMAWQSYKQKVEEAKQASIDAANAAKEEADNITSLLNKYNQLTEEVKTNSAAKDDLLSTQAELLESLGIEQSQIEKLVKQYGSLSKAINQVSIDRLKDMRTDLIAGLDATREELLKVGSDGFWGINNIISATGDDAVKAFKELEKAKVVSSSSFGTGGGQLVLIGDDQTAEGILENYKRLEEALNVLRDSNAFTAEELSNNSLYQAIYNRYNEMKEKVEAYNSSIKSLNENLAQQTVLAALQGNEIPKTEEEFEKFKQQMIDIAQASGKFIGAQEEIKDSIANVLSEMPEFESFIKSIADLEEDAGGKTDSSFASVWQDTADDVKEKLLELAKAGELTPETLRSTSEYEKILKQTGLTAKEVANKINSLVSSADQLAAMGSGVKSLSDNLSTKKESPKKVIDYDTLSGMSDELKENTKEWEEYVRVMGTASSTLEDCRKVTNKLATAFVNNHNFLANLTNKTKEYYISQLKAMGVGNAEAVVEAKLAQKHREAAEAKQIEAIKSQVLIMTKDGVTTATLKEVSALFQEESASKSVQAAIVNLIAKENILSNTSLNTDQKISQLNELASAYFGAAAAAEFMNMVQTSSDGALYGGGTISPDKAWAEIWKKYSKKAKATTKISIPKVSVSPTNYSTSTKDSDSKKKTKTKASKQEVDWISRMLDVLQQKVDLLKAKFENLFAIGKKQNNLTQQISKTTKLLAVQEKVVKRYQQIADNYYKKNKKKLSSNGITLNMLQNGSLDVKSYKSSISEIIQTYQNYYDKAKEAKQATIELIKEIRDLSKQKLEIKLEDNERKRTYQEAKYANATTAKEKNKILDKEIAIYSSDDTAYKNYYKRAKKLRNQSGKIKVNNIKGLTKDDKRKIRNKIKKGKEIPTALMKKVAKVSKATYDLLVDYNSNVDFVSDVLRDKKLAKEQNKTNIREAKIEKQQNLADEYEASYNLNQQYEANAVSAKDKNKYEKESLKDLENQYKKLIKIAKLEGDTIEAERLKAELVEKTNESIKKQYDNIKEEYDMAISLNNALIATTQSEIEALQANGKTVAEEFYRNMMATTEQNRKKLLEEKAELEKKLSDFEVASPDWYTAKEDLEAINQSIYQCDVSLAEFQKTINDLNMKPFKLMNMELENANAHIKFLTDYLSHKDLTSKDALGLTDAGFATLSLNISEMENNTKIIENAQKAMKELQKQYKSGIYTEEEYLELYNEQVEIIRDATLANEELKDSMIDLVEDAFDIQISALEDLIQKRKEAIRKEKDLYSYQIKVAKQTKEIANIQKQIAALTGDSSEEARAKIQKLQVSLEEAQQDLKDTEYDKWISDQEDMLDDLLDELENFFENLKKDPEKLLSAIEKAIREQPQMLIDYFDSIGLGDARSFDTVYNDDGSKTSNSTDYGGNSYQNSYDKNGTSTNNSYSSNISSDYKEPDSGTSSTGGDYIRQSTPEEANRFDELRRQMEEELLKAQAEAETAKREQQLKIDKLLDENLRTPVNTSDSGRIATDKFLQYLNEKYDKRILSRKKEAKLAKILGVEIKDENKITYAESVKLLDAFKNAGYSQGGIVSAADILQHAIVRNNDDVIGTLKIGERVLDPVNSKEFGIFNDMMPDYVDAMQDIFGRNMPDTGQYVTRIPIQPSINVGDVNVHLDGSNVIDSDSFIEAFRNSTGMQNIVKNCVANDMAKAYRNTLGRI